jgi:xanthine dehydrogenase small subunit
MATLHFLLNGLPVEESEAPATMTVLDYLRTTRRLTGTKEGCAEGDCGACTIAVAGPGTEPAYRAVNSCLMLVPQLDGAAVVTVDGLAADGSLHPVQQAMLETDATQCGFCTPGFVMSMFAMHHDGTPAEDGAIHEALAGNLCRCTGYRPIVDACRHIAGPAAALPGRLAGRPASDMADTYGTATRFLAPDSLAALVEARAAHPDAWLLAGGTDLGLLVGKERQRPAVLISTARVPELRRIADSAEALELGAAVTYTDALPHLDAAFPAFAAIVRRIGSRQIRNLGTIAGNLANASPIGDTLPCLMALDAEVRLRGPGGARTLKVADFITGYRKTALAADEVIEAVRIPRLGPGQLFAAYKLSKRFDQDISTVVAAFRVDLADGRVASIRVAYGGMAAQVKRAAAVETALAGRVWTAAALDGIEAALARDYAPMGDQRAGAAYRRAAAANLLRRLVAETTEGPPAVRLEAL